MKSCMTIFRFHAPAPLNEGICARAGRLIWDYLVQAFPYAGHADRCFGTVERTPLPFRVVKPGGHMGYLVLEVELSCRCTESACLEALEDLTRLVRKLSKTPVEALLVRFQTPERVYWCQGDGVPFDAECAAPVEECGLGTGDANPGETGTGNGETTDNGNAGNPETGEEG